jgi:2-polyprenyl-6-methoxyphenol hydroxylase-like FAD-dependent oxidoreductase
VRALIAGARIAGLTTALSLHAAGSEALTIESALELMPTGVGINLSTGCLIARERCEARCGHECGKHRPIERKWLECT